MVGNRGMGKIRKRPLVFAVGYIIATAVSLGMLTVSPQTVSADGAKTLENAARAWLMFNFMSKHIITDYRGADYGSEQVKFSDGLSQVDVDQLRFVSAGSNPLCWAFDSGYLLSPSNGELHMDKNDLGTCGAVWNDNTNAQDAFSAALSGVGYDRASLVAEMGFKKDSSGLYKGGQISKEKYTEVLKKKWPASISMQDLNSNTPPLWIQYLDLVTGIQKAGCAKAELMNFPYPDNKNGTIVWLVGADGTAKQYSVEANNKDFPVAIGGKISCQQALDRLKDGDGSKAKEYARLLGTLKEAINQDCAAKYSSDNKLKATCEKGVEKKDDPEFCTENYPNQPDLDACKFGQEYAKTNQLGATTPAEGAKEQKTCVIDGVGWIVCPVAKFVAGIVDGIFKYMIMPMIVTPPVNTSTQDNQLLSAWGTMRNIANVIFIIAFMIVIYSQITSAGISNYGIKRMLPRLIIGAILLNTSYWICALAVDLSNVAGASIYNILMGIFNTTLNNTTWEAVIGVLLAGGVAGAGAGFVIGAIVALGAGSPALMAALWIAIPLLIGAFLAVITAAVVLALRQALIVILIVISPLAIAAYLLPNTQQWYEKWQKMFITMLVFFPLFSIIYGGSQVAASILVAASANAGKDKDMTAVILLLTAMVAQVFPLFSAPFVMKFSGGVLGSIGAKIQGGFGKLTAPINKYAKGRAGKNLELGKGRAFNGAGALANRDVGRIRGRFTRGVGRTLQGISSRGQRLDMGLEAAKAESEAIAAERAAVNPTLSDLDTQTRLQKERAESASRVQTEDYVSRLNANAGGEIATAAGIGGAAAQSRVRTKAQSAEQKVYEDAVKMADESARNNHMTFDQRLDAARGIAADGVTQLSEAERDAHIQFAMGAGNTKERRSVLESAGSMTASQRSSAVGGARSKGDTELWGSSTLGKIEDGDASAMSDVAGTLKSSLQQRLAGGAVGGQKITGDNHTADMVMQEMSTMSSSDQESARANIDRFVSSEQGRGVTGEVRSTLGIAGAPASTSSAGASAPTGDTLTVEHGGRTYEQSPSGLLTPRDR